MFYHGAKRCKKGWVAGIPNKKNITLTLTVTVNGKALPFQAIHKRKTKLSLPKVIFPTNFSLTANMSTNKHHDNTRKVLKHL